MESLDLLVGGECLELMDPLGQRVRVVTGDWLVLQVQRERLVMLAGLVHKVFKV